MFSCFLIGSLNVGIDIFFRRVDTGQARYVFFYSLEKYISVYFCNLSKLGFGDVWA